MNPAPRRCAARLILPAVLSALVAAGCGGPPEQEDGLADAGGPSHLLSAPLRDSDQLPTDDAPPVASDEAPFADPPLVAGDPSPFPDPPPVAGDEAPSGRGCNPNYDPCVPIDSDVDCEGGRGNGPSYVAGPVRVVGRDPYGLDRDGDGVGCDS